MNIIKIYSFLCILFISGNCLADVKVYLFPTAVMGKDGIKVEDIGKIEGPLEAIELLRGIRIEKGLCRDGFVGRKELHGFLRDHTGEEVHIYGNGVKVSIEKGDAEKVLNEEGRAIKSGDVLKLAIIRKGIRIEVDCTAGGDGTEGDTIPVRLKNNRTLKGTIINKRLVETRL